MVVRRRLAALDNSRRLLLLLLVVLLVVLVIVVAAIAAAAAAPLVVRGIRSLPCGALRLVRVRVEPVALALQTKSRWRRLDDSWYTTVALLLAIVPVFETDCSSWSSLSLS